MGPGIVIIFWLIIAGIFGSFWIGALLLFLFSKKKNWPIIKWLSGFAVVGGIIIGIAMTSLLTYGFVRASVPKYVFADVFYSKPTNDIQDIKSKVYWFADTGSIYLSFSTDISTFRKLVPKHLPKSTKKEFENHGMVGSSAHPDWWLSTVSDSDEIYFTPPRNGDGENFTYESEWMVYNFQRKMGYYQFLGID